MAAVALAWSCFSSPTEALELAKGERSVSRILTVSTMVATPVAVVTFAAPLVVTTPTQTVAPFSVLPLLEVASVVDALLMDQVLLSRYGGRFGP